MSRSYQARTLPFRITLPPSVSTVIRDASSSALRCNAFSIFSLTSTAWIGEATRIVQLVHDMVGFGLLKLPIDVAGQRHHTLLDLDLDPVGGDSDLPLQDVDCACCNLVVRAFRIRRQAHLDFLGDRPDPFDAPRGALRHRLLDVARHKAGQGDHTVIRSYADMGGIDAGLEFELVENVLPKL